MFILKNSPKIMANGFHETSHFYQYQYKWCSVRKFCFIANKILHLTFNDFLLVFVSLETRSRDCMTSMFYAMSIDQKVVSIFLL